MRITTPDRVDHPTADANRLGPLLRPGLLVVIAGAVFADGALLTAAYRGSSPVADDRLSFPWDGATAVTTSLLWGGAQLLFVLGLCAFARSNAITGRAGRRGAWAAVVGGALYTAAHATSALFHDADVNDAGAMVALMLFGVGTVLTAIGMLVAGRDVATSGSWSGWRRHAPLAFGGWLLVMVPLQFTAVLPVAVAIYAGTTIALGVAMLDETLSAATNHAP